MKMFTKSALLFIVLWVPVWVFCLFLGVSGCDYVPRTEYEIETKDGNTLKLLCPTVDRYRSEFTYVTDGDCVVVK